MERFLGADLSRRLGDIERGLRSLGAALLEPFIVTQLVLIVVAAGLALLIGPRIEAALEGHVRAIKGQPRLLRFLALLLRRTTSILAGLLLGIALLALQAARPLRHPAILEAVLALVAAWVAISVVSRLIRNRSVARLVAWGAWVIVALRITGTFDIVQHGLDSLAISVGSVRVSVWLLLQGVVTVAALLWLAIGLGNFIERRIALSPDLTPSVRVLVGKLVKILLLVLAGGVALNVLGIDATALAFFGGALGLGIGFGLQKVVSNFVSGIIILLDKSIKPGDTIAIGETFGWVRSLRARFVSVITRDGREYLIPNEDFVTQRVENWSFTDPLVRIDVTFGVAYDSDPHQVRRLAVGAVQGIDRVEASPTPVCHLTGFGESSLDFILRFWISDPQNGVTNVRGATLLACWDAFKEAGISIPYPHRQIVTDGPVPVHVVGAAD